MKEFRRGDILIGRLRSFKKAYHPIIYYGGSKTAPLAVIMTHSGNFPCNIKLFGHYDNQTSFFVAHLIEKLTEWGPYQIIGKLQNEDLSLIDDHLSLQVPITWQEYLNYKENGCPLHGKL